MDSRIIDDSRSTNYILWKLQAPFFFESAITKQLINCRFNMIIQRRDKYVIWSELIRKSTVTKVAYCSMSKSTTESRWRLKNQDWNYKFPNLSPELIVNDCFDHFISKIYEYWALYEFYIAIRIEDGPNEHWGHSQNA